MSWIREHITRPLFERVRDALPAVSETERQALEAGDVWWDADLLSGRPDWNKLIHDTGDYQLSPDEQAFIDGPVDQLCEMIDDWQINFEHRRLPANVWSFLRDKGFFGMIIPKQYNGLGFSAAAHSEVVSRIATRSTAVAVTVMVPNSLGPGELLMHYGTEDQKNHYLPRLADGREIPCFGLTSPEAGSDASAMVDVGVICYGQWQGERTLGMRLNWHKRYITLGPVATLLGLAFKMTDPDHILGDEEDLGITLALVPTDTPGVDIGKRHLPCLQAFQNGPNWGRDVFLPLSAIIGGQQRIGQGWQMLMSALAAGRSISLPGLSAGTAKLCARTAGQYSRVRQQFGIPIGKFEGIQARLADIAGAAYVIESARRVTTLALDAGHAPSLISAIIKSQTTFRARAAVTDAMDIHGGKGVCDGPSNYLGNAYRGIPVAITVEGANILTRNLIIFGQGSIRCHPFLLTEIFAASDADPEAGLEKFESVIYRHLRHAAGNFLRSLTHGLTASFLARHPRGAEPRRYYQKLSRFAAALGFVTEVVLIHLGGALKRKEMISARLGDVLSELYLLSCVLKRFHSDGEPASDLPLVAWCCESGLQSIERSFDEVFCNYPSTPIGLLLRMTTFPLGRHHHGPSDELSQQCAELLMSPSPVFERLTNGVYKGRYGDGIYRLERAFEQVIACAPLHERLREKQIDAQQALEQGVITDQEAEQLRDEQEAITASIAVDYFEADMLSPSPGQDSTSPLGQAAGGYS
jgi:acyl-CoA dehydrogenase